jgi:hypothetical protein
MPPTLKGSVGVAKSRTYVEIGSSPKWTKTHVRFINSPNQNAGASICRRALMDFEERRPIKRGERPTCKLCLVDFDAMKRTVTRR